MLTYNRTLPNISEVVRKSWHILQNNPEFCNVFVNKPTIPFKNLKQHLKYTRPHKWPFKKNRKNSKVKEKLVLKQDQVYVVAACKN